MKIQTHKNIQPEFASIRPMNLYKQWTLTDLDITTKPNLKSYMSASAASASWSGDLDVYYNTIFSGSVPNFPGLNVKYARYYPNETGSMTEPNYEIYDEEYTLSYNYLLGNGDRFYPTYQSTEVTGGLNPDGTYARMVHYSLQRLFYSGNSVYYSLLFGSSSQLLNEAIVIEIPQRYVADTIEPGTFVLRDSSDINKLPYSSGSWQWSIDSGSTDSPNTIASNFLASEGIKLIDDSRGNLYDANYISTTQRGNIFYKLGLAVITDMKYAQYFREYLIVSGNII